MEYILKLHPTPFNKIRQWIKTIETRLLDKKRRQIKIDDVIIFQKRPDFKYLIKTKVTGIKKYKSFADIPSSLYYWEYKELWVEEKYHKQEFVKQFQEYYSKEDEQKYWVVVFEFEIINI